MRQTCEGVVVCQTCEGVVMCQTCDGVVMCQTCDGVVAFRIICFKFLQYNILLFLQLLPFPAVVIFRPVLFTVLTCFLPVCFPHTSAYRVLASQLTGQFHVGPYTCHSLVCLHCGLLTWQWCVLPRRFVGGQWLLLVFLVLWVMWKRRGRVVPAVVRLQLLSCGNVHTVCQLRACEAVADRWW